MKSQNKLKLQTGCPNIVDGTSYYVFHQKVFYGYFSEIPSVIQLHDIDKESLQNWIQTYFKERPFLKHKKENYEIGAKKPKYSNEIYVLPEKIVIDIEGSVACVLYSYQSESKAQVIIDSIRKLKRKKKEPSINVVTVNSFGMDLEKFKCARSKFKLNENYNNDLIELDKNIIETLNQKDSAGIYMFHGKPGTGKTSYIRHLISRVKRKVIFLPLQIAETVDSPNLIRLLIDNRHSIMVVEDAERLLASRDSEKNFGISTILNITDGLLSDSLGIKIICTFNTHLSNIDTALLRKGRLKALYEFKPLEITKAKALLEKTGIKGHEVTEAMTLADIYNFKEQNAVLNISGRSRIGFNSKVA